MSTITCRIAECAEEVQREAARIMALAPVLSPEALEGSLRAIRLQAAQMEGLAKSLAGAVSVQSTAVHAELGRWP